MRGVVEKVGLLVAGPLDNRVAIVAGGAYRRGIRRGGRRPKKARKAG